MTMQAIPALRGVLVGVVRPWCEVRTYKIPMLMATATPIFSRLYMLNRSSNLHGSSASAKSENVEYASNV